VFADDAFVAALSAGAEAKRVGVGAGMVEFDNGADEDQCVV
jgi:hypothetical protein